MSDITPLSSYDSRQRIQLLWEYLQRDIVELEAETDQSPEQIWLDFINQDVVNGTQFFKDFLELYYVTRLTINKKNDPDVTRLLREINGWKDNVKMENMNVEHRKSYDRLNLISQGINLFRRYEVVLLDNNYVQVINNNSSMK